MISSMTGFGLNNIKNEHMSLTAQVKSVNGRFLEVRFRMPRDYAALEGELKKIVSQRIQRGTVDVTLFRTYETKSAPLSVTPNIALAKAWKAACEELNKEVKLPEPVYHEILGRVPDVMQIEEALELAAWEKDVVVKAVTGAVTACINERAREGQDQYKTFSDLLDGLETFIGSVKKQKADIDTQLQTKLHDRLKTINDAITIDPQRLAQEVVFLTEKADIAEELARADAHIRAFREVLKSKEAVGKKLEFYTQELHREVNTMGSKTQALAVTLNVIEAKTCIERLREQVQNVE